MHDYRLLVIIGGNYCKFTPNLNLSSPSSYMISLCMIKISIKKMWVRLTFTERNGRELESDVVSGLHILLSNLGLNKPLVHGSSK